MIAKAGRCGSDSDLANVLSVKTPCLDPGERHQFCVWRMMPGGLAYFGSFCVTLSALSLSGHALVTTPSLRAPHTLRCATAAQSHFGRPPLRAATHAAVCPVSVPDQTKPLLCTTYARSCFSLLHTQPRPTSAMGARVRAAGASMVALVALLQLLAASTVGAASSCSKGDSECFCKEMGPGSTWKSGSRANTPLLPACKVAYQTAGAW